MDENDPRHGTAAGYSVHRRHGERPCVACREGNREYKEQWREARRQAGVTSQYRPVRTCEICGLRHKGKYDWCARCRTSGAQWPESEIALPPGAWRLNPFTRRQEYVPERESA